MAILLAALIISCGGRQTIPEPDLGWPPSSDENASVDTVPLQAADTLPALPPRTADKSTGEPDSTGVAGVVTSPSDSLLSGPKGPSEEDSLDKSTAWLFGATGGNRVPPPISRGEVDNEDSASAVDDAVWRMLGLAEEYHSMGVLANREANWEEAQYYFEKAIKIMAGLDIETDMVPTPEAAKYNTLLDNIISDYRLTLRSLGQLEGDITPSVLIERFGDLEKRLEGDTLHVFGQREPNITYDLPIKMNDRVKSSIVYFQTIARDAFLKYLGRSKKYDRIIKDVLARQGLPQDLAYLCLVESGFNPKAYSWARASGLWQFIASTGRLYGLERDWWVDERRDPVKSTEAAARFLKDLYNEFGDWELAMAAYNGGPGRIRNTIKSQGTVDFWKMRLRRQTMDYVPLIYAAAIIAKDPVRYGFGEVEYESALLWDEVTIDRCLDLRAVADAVECSVDNLKEYNPELLRNYTPPSDQSYVLKLPYGSREKFKGVYASLPSPQATSWVTHTIRKGETIGSIAAKYGVSQYAIMESNQLGRSTQIIAGKNLIVPVPLDREFSTDDGKKNREYVADGSVYTVRQGDTMWDIARAFATSVDALRRVNYIERGARIYVGQRLKIPSDAGTLKKRGQPDKPPIYAYEDRSSADAPPQAAISSGENQTHKVRAGDTLWEIARMYGTTTANLRRLNNLGRSGRLYPGQILQVGGSAVSQEFILYTVQSGDNLAQIAKQFGTSIARILALNELDDPDNLQVGQILKINSR